jgi:hypothetical protein
MNVCHWFQSFSILHGVIFNFEHFASSQKFLTNSEVFFSSSSKFTLKFYYKKLFVKYLNSYIL